MVEMGKTIVIDLQSCGENASEAVNSALKELKTIKNSTLRFEKGEYHFYKSGTTKKFYAVSNNAAREREIVFHICGFEGLTIDGGGSVFFFHDLVFPFVVSESKNVRIQNFYAERKRFPQVAMKVKDVKSDGFSLMIDENSDPYRVENGSLIFEREWGEFSGKSQMFGLLRSSPFTVQYMFTGNCEHSDEGLAATHINVDATPIKGGVKMTFRHENRYPLRFSENDTVMSNLDGGRTVDLIFLDRSKEITISDVTVCRAVGMGIIAQICRDIEVDNFSVSDKYKDSPCSSLTADALHFVNCFGKLDIHDCKISHVGDDVINVHGMYTSVDKWDENTLYSEIKHSEQKYFNPYEMGDRLEIIDNDSFEAVAEFVVCGAEIFGDDGAHIKISGHFTKGKEKMMKGFLIEIPDKMPDLHLHDNDFSYFPHMRISGAGKTVIENNRIQNASKALVSQDLAKYWYESGRVKNLVFRNNDINNILTDAAIYIGIDGIDEDKCPKIHEYVEISENKFGKLKDKAIVTCGARNLVIRDNIFEDSEGIIKIDGKELEF